MPEGENDDDSLRSGWRSPEINADSGAVLLLHNKAFLPICNILFIYLMWVRCNATQQFSLYHSELSKYTETIQIKSWARSLQYVPHTKSTNRPHERLQITHRKSTEGAREHVSVGFCCDSAGSRLRSSAIIKHWPEAMIAICVSSLAQILTAPKSTQSTLPAWYNYCVFLQPLVSLTGNNNKCLLARCRDSCNSDKQRDGRKTSRI